MIMTREEIFEQVRQHRLSRADALRMLRELDAPAPAAADDGTVNGVAAILHRIIHVPLDEITPDASFSDMGVDSISAVEIIRDVNQTFGLTLEAISLYDHSTPRKLAGHIAASRPREVPAPAPQPEAPAPAPARAPRPTQPQPRSQPQADGRIAVIGLSCRFPGARDAESFWDAVASARDCVGEVPVERWDVEQVFDPDPRAPNRSYSRWGGFLDDVDAFDAAFFGITPAEAELMDPQQRIVLEECWKALEDAGCDPTALASSRCGVFLGAAASGYADPARAEKTAQLMTGLSVSILPARIAYFLDLTGPCMTVDTACSSSLVAVHLACQSILAGESELAIAGGVALLLGPELHVLTSKAAMLSPTGRCRTFDQAADGVVLSEGTGVVVLKPLAAALADGDPIRAVIRATGVNYDGHTNGISAPSVRSQERLVRDVHERAGIDVRDIGYVEAHGTGTPLGDPIEVTALAQAFGKQTTERGFCAIGSVKVNIGHCTAAAGVAGLINAVHALEHEVVPPLAHFTEANDKIRFDDTPFFVATRPVPWPRGRRPRLAAVSSFGYTGTNCHVVLEEAPPLPARAESHASRIVPVSAKTEAALGERIAQLSAWLATHDASLDDVAATLSRGRAHFPVRRAFVASSIDELRAALAKDEEGSLPAAAREYVAGGAVPPNEGGRRIPLPAYPFARERFWRRERKVSLLEEQRQYIDAHRLGGRRILPAAVSLALAVDASRATLLRRVTWERPLAFEQDEPVRGELVVTVARDTFEAAVDGTVLMSGAFASGAVERSPIDVEAVLRRCPERLDGAELYRRLSAAGFEYGPALRTIAELHAGDGELVALLEPRGNDARTTLDPALLDSALVATTHLAASLGATGTFLPFAAEDVAIFGALRGRCRAVVTTLPNTSGSALRFSIVVAAESGMPLVRIGALTLVRAMQPELAYFRYEWAAANEVAPRAAGASLVLRTPGDVARVLAGSDALPDTLVYAPAESRNCVETAFTLSRALLRGRAALPLRLLCVVPAGEPAYAAIAGLTKTLRREQPELLAKTIEFAGGANLDAIVACESDSRLDVDEYVRYDGTRRFVERTVSWIPPRDGALPLRRGGVYLIAGGAGGLGRIFARHLADRYDARVVLCGRSPVPGLANYEVADVTNRDDVERLLAGIREKHGRVDGVIHSAAIVRDAFVIHKEPHDFAAVLAPKVLGAMHLDAATADDDLSCFVLFAAAASARGNAGQADYAAANAFLDAFAEWRERERLAGRRRGRSVSIDWPLWDGGGMTVDDATRAWLERTTGMLPLPPSRGIAAFEDLLRGDASRVVVAYGDAARLARSLAAEAPAAHGEVRSNDQLRAPLRDHLARTIASVTKLAPERLQSARFDTLGIDSVVALNINELLERDFGPLARTLFFEYHDIDALAGFFLAHHAGRVETLLGGAEAPSAPPRQPVAAPIPTRKEAPRDTGTDAIAIIGMAGRYPLSPSLDALWQNLRDGRNCVTPVDRWASEAPRYGGLLDGVDQFDAAFFGFTPGQAALLDPQERLFLETVWEAVESAGWTRRALEQLQRERGRGVGVFAGCMYQHYPLFAAAPDTRAILTNHSYWLLANRVSHFFGFTGPSLAVDAACASSVTAIHLACESLRRGESVMAIAGAVNLSLHPSKYLGLAQAGVLASGGESRSLGAGDGYVPGEGVGAVLLRRLKDAEAEGDTILGVIEATALAHMGAGNAMPTPNPRAIAETFARALDACNVTPAQIGYVEMAANGVPVGDAVEVEGIERVFREAGVAAHACAIGSVKSNLGHLEAASGMSQLAKVVLQLRCGTLVPTLHSEPLNPHIRHGDDSPLIIQRHAQWWRGPRRAAISSYGAGGTLGVVIVSAAETTPAREVESDELRAFPLSARTRSALLASVARLRDGIGDEALDDIAYTLQNGRETFEEQVTLYARDREELRAACDEFLSGGAPSAEAEGLKPVSGRRVPLPTYPFERVRCWIDERQPAPTVEQCVANILGLSSIDADAPWSELGLDSIGMARLKFVLERDLGMDVPVAEIAAAGSARRLGRRDDAFPLSPIQEAFLVGRQFGGDDRVGCHVYLELAFESLDVPRLERAWNRVIQTHEMLRAVVQADGTQRIQAGVPEQRIPIGTSPEETRRAMSHRVYEAGEWPLFDVRVTVLSERETRLHLSIDEWIADAAGIRVLLDEWRALYESPECELAPPGIRFRDYLAAVARAPHREDDLAYWSRKLASAPHAASLWRDASGDPVRRRITGRIEASEWSALRELARDHGVSPTTLVLTLFGDVLRTAARGESFPLVLTYFNRLPVHPDVDRLVAPAISTTIFTPSHADAPLAERLTAHQKQLWEDLDHTSVSGIEVLRELKHRGTVPRDLVLPVVFTSLLGDTGDKSGWLERVVESVSQTPQVWLDHQVWQHEGALRISWDVAVARFAPGVVETLFDDFLGRLRMLAMPPVPARFTVRPGAASRQPIPLSDQQQAYLLGRLQGGANTTPSLFYQELEVERVDVERLNDAWNRVVAMHDALRAVVGDDLRLSVLPEVERYAVADRGLSTAELRERLSARVFAHDRWPLFELELSRNTLHVAIDMLVADGASLTLILRDLLAFYTGAAEPRAPQLSFGDYQLALAGYRRTPAAQEDLDYWRARMDRLAPGPLLPSRGGERHVRERFSTTLFAWPALRARAESLCVPAGAILLAAYGDVLRDWCGGAACSFVVVNWDRPPVHPDIDRVAGDFTALTWADAGDDGMTFEQRVLAHARRLREDLRHTAVSALAAARRNAAAPPFSVVFTNLAPNAHGRLEGARAGHGISQTPGVLLDNIVFDEGGQLVIHWDAAVDCLDRSDVAARLDAYRARLEQLACDPGSWHALTATTKSETAEPWQTTLQALLAAQAKRTPDAIAIEYGTSTLTYAALHDRVRAWARRLRAHGVGPDTVVAVLMERSVEMVTALLAIVEAGGAYMPLDPEHPEERIRYMLADSATPVVLTQQRHAAKVTGGSAAIIALDAEAPGEHPTFVSETGPDHLAYVIYTSGSTGQPKGCMVPHSAICNRLQWMQAAYPLSADDRVLQKTPYTFDVSVWEFFWPLLTGARIVIARPGGHQDARYLAGLIQSAGVTVCHFVPSMLRVFLTVPESRGCRSLRVVFASGEALPYALVEQYLDAFTAPLVNLYGPTEAAVDVTHWPCVRRADRKVPIGAPIANVQLYVLDENLRRVPRGETGELHIGGAGVGRGYLRRDDLTAAKFISNPFSPGRMYKTGDLARELEDGTFEYLGRRDAQIKVRGMRIEPAEIEAALEQHPRVREAAVTVDGSGGEDPRLVALLVTRDGAPLSASDVRSFAAAKLPEAMLPNFVVSVPSLPVTMHGKLDRAALPALLHREEAATPKSGDSIVRRLLSYAEPLIGAAVPADGDLFDLGATSLTIFRIAREIEQREGVRIPVELFLETPTLAAVAAYIERQQPAAPAPKIELLGDEERSRFKEQRLDLRRFGSDAARIPIAATAAARADHLRRSSRREFLDTPVTLASLAGLLALLREEEVDGRARRLYPSGGGLYAVQTYVHVRAVEGLAEGIYYFDPSASALVLVNECPSMSRADHFFYNRAIYDGSAFGIFFIAQLDAIRPLYGDASVPFVTLEAGYMGELLMLRQAELGLGLCPVAGVDPDRLRADFALDEGHHFVHAMLGGPVEHVARTTPVDGDVAIVGMSGRYPGARTLDEFWRVLAEGRDCIREVPRERWDFTRYARPTAGAGAACSRWGAFLDDVDAFDPLFFGISPREAEYMDPQERLFLEVAWEALEDAGYSPELLARTTGGRVGVFAGVMYGEYELFGLQELLQGKMIATGSVYASVANRVSHFLDVHGPSMAVDTMCSSSLTALHLAVQSIRNGECVMALAGGVNLSLHPSKFLLHAQMGMPSGDGRCKAFGDGGDGFVAGEGVGAVLLKPLPAAIADGDVIHGVIKAVRVNHNGHTSGITVPSRKAQSALIAETLDAARVDPRTISYVEAHGTGTILGDPIEIDGLTDAYRRSTWDRGFCAIGSVKSNIGHLEAAAGVAGLTKIVLQMRHGQLAPSLHADVLHPGIDFDATPFRVQRALAEWPRTGPRRAALSSFGAGGANAHVIVEEAPPREAAVRSDVPSLIVLSARTQQQLAEVAARLAAHLRTHDADLRDVAFTLQTGRRALNERHAFVTRDRATAIEALEAFARGESYPSLADRTLGELAAQWMSGSAVDWTRLPRDGRPRRVSLPTYPFDRRRFWIGRSPDAFLPAPQKEETSEARPPKIAVPRWRPAVTAPAEGEPASWAWIVRPESQQALAEAIASRLDVPVTIAGIDDAVVARGGRGRVFFLAPPQLEESAIALFRLARGLRDSAIDLTVVTQRVHAVLADEEPVPWSAGVLGLARTLAREEPSWSVACVDVEDASAAALLAAPQARQRGDDTAIRGGHHYERRLVLAGLPAAVRSRFRRHGVYLMAGGAGTVGFELSLLLARRYGARVVWCGRRARTDEIDARIARIAEAGGEAIYVTADVSSAEAMRGAIEETKRRFGRIDGALYLAMHLVEGRLDAIGERELLDALAAKARGSAGFADVLRDEPLDFLLFCNSGQSFTGNAGRGAYAAACTFQDAFANALAIRARYPVRVADWGFWNAGAMASAEGRQRAEQEGVIPLQPESALEVIERLLDNSAVQVFAFDVRDGLLPLMGIDPADRIELRAMPDPSPWTLAGEDIARDLAANRVERRDPPAAVASLVSRALAELDLSHAIARYARLVPALRDIAARVGGTASDAPPEPGWEPQLRLLEVCLARYADILSGRIAASDVLFPNGSTELVDGIYRGNAQADQFNALLARCARRYADTRGSGEIVRVLEVGAGTGGTTAAVVPELARAGVATSFIYTDVAPALVRLGQERFGARHRFMEFRTLDIERDPAAQGFDPGTFDLVIATNVLHATRDLRTTLAHVRALLAPGGWLLLNEMDEAQDFLTLTFGLLDGWWRFEDEDVRLPHAPLADAATWRRLLSEEGFAHVAMTGAGAGQRLFVAEAGAERCISVRPVEGSAPRIEIAAPRPRIAAVVERTMRDVLHLEVGDLDPDVPHASYGIDSLAAVEIVDRLNATLGITLHAPDLFNYPTARALSEYIAASYEVAEERHSVVSVPRASSDIAVIGMAGRFPGALNVDAFWENLAAGRDCIGPIPPSRFDAEDVGSAPPFGGFLDDADCFDSLFFNISPAEARLMDPQQRVVLEEVWKALEDAGLSDRAVNGARCSVFVGCKPSDYARAVEQEELSQFSLSGNSNAILAARPAYILNLKGASVPVDTACSSSLVAVHLACETLRGGSCDLAIAGGVALMPAAGTHVLLGNSGMLAPDGRCKTFDARADGFVPGEAAAVVVLKRLDDALRDGDRIHAVIKGSAVNQDGRTNGITAPNGPSQTQLVRDVYERFAIDPSTIGYVEAHGTGTVLGDPIELQALTDAFRTFTSRRGFCAIGSAKTNVGHCLEAAGMAGLIKAILCVQRQTLVPSLHFTAPNPKLDFDGSPFFVGTSTAPWTSDGPRRAAVSAFGFSGTNAHVVVEEPPAIARSQTEWTSYVFPVSAKSAEALQRRIDDLRAFVGSTDARLGDIAFTLAVGRSHFAHRAAFVAGTREELLRMLAGETPSPANELASRYTRGEEVEWAHVYRGSDFRRTALPAYPFARERHWVETRRERGPSLRAYRRAWVPAPLPDDMQAPGAVVVIGDDDLGLPHATLAAPEARDAAGWRALLDATGARHIVMPLDDAPRLDVRAAADAKARRELLPALQAAQALAARGGEGRVVFVRRGRAAIPGGAFPGLFRTISLEHPSLDFRVVECESVLDPRELAVRAAAPAVRYDASGTRSVLGMREVTLHATPPAANKPVYLISGGAGGIGGILARHLAHTRGARLALLGRSPQNGRSSALLRELHELGGEAFYLQADVSDASVVERALDTVRLRFGALQGVIHCAGVAGTGLVRGGAASMRAVIAPKLAGAMLLDEATRNEPLELFALCSSMTGILGHVAQASYAWANGALDELAAERERLREAGRRSGRTVSIAWPVWAGGGMSVSSQDLALLAEATGLHALPTDAALRAFDGAAGGDAADVLVLYGDAPRFSALLEGRSVEPAPLATSSDAQRNAEELVTRMMSELLRLPARDIAPTAPFEELGFDSLLIQRFNTAIEEHFGTVPKTLLFERRTCRDVARYLAAQEPKPQRAAVTTPRMADDHAIAVIGMAGRYPAAADLDAFWRNLAAGVDAVSVVPRERWDAERFYDPDPSRAAEGKAYCRWGGFVEGAADFDPLFFGISPREAASIDPQERLFLEIAWQTLEEAGYTGRRLQKLLAGHRGADAGVFAGVTSNAYQLLGTEAWVKGNLVEASSLAWSIANRVSFFFDFGGPSMPVDTACSSSLTAIHLACRSLRAGECRIALAGGVNLYLHPSKYVAMCRTRMLSPTGRCHAFGAGADGFVPGEGVGALLLARLEDAQRNGDRILAVIRGSAINHGGRTNGYTVPDPEAQARLIRAALEDAHLTPRDIGCIEAHGTGTALGDPIELRGLSLAFSSDPPAACAIGSVKTNIGHLESAAGIAGVTKAILQLKHRQLVPSLHAEELNPAIDLDGGPFRIQRTLEAWPETQPPRVAVSSFGAGGANAHVIVERYDAPERAARREDGPFAFVFSARTAERLHATVARMRDAIAEASDLAAVAYTLQSGRESMTERMGAIAATREELLAALDAFLAGGEAPFRGNVRAERQRIDALWTEEERREVAAKAIERRDLQRLLRLWTSGVEIEWERLWPEPPPIVCLPPSPFERQRCWLKTGEAADEAAPAMQTAFVPRWVERTASPRPRVSGRTLFIHSPATRIAAPTLGGEQSIVADEASIETILDGLHEPLAEVCFLAAVDPVACDPADWNAIERAQEAGVIGLFRLVKMLLARGYESRPLRVCIVTNDFRGASLHGFARGAARDLPRWQFSGAEVSLEGVDTASPAELARVLREALDAAPEPRGEDVAFRGGRRYVRTIEPVELRPADAPSLLQPGGRYLIIGGAGSIGREIGRSLTVRLGARVAVMGRRPEAEVRRELGDAFYVRGDVTDPDSLRAAMALVRERFGGIDGVIHSALVIRKLEREPLASIGEDELRRVMAPHVRGSVALYEALRGASDVRFIAFFSSAQSFAGFEGRTHYAAACSFKDAYAACLAEEGGPRVQVINWGFWDDGAIPATTRERLARQGVGFIDPRSGVELFWRAMASSPRQLLAFGLEPDAVRALGVEPDRPAVCASSAAPPLLHVAGEHNVTVAAGKAELSRYAGASERLETLARTYLLGQLRVLGILAHGGETLDWMRAGVAAGVAPRHRKLWSSLPPILARGGFVTLSGDRVRATEWLDDASLLHALQQLPVTAAEVAREFPEIAAHVQLIARSMPRYAEVLRDAVPATDVLFPNPETNLLAAIYKGNPVSDFFNELVARNVREYALARLATLPAGEPLRILEVGAGAGGTTTAVVDALRDLGPRIRYVFTDLSPTFVRQGRRTFGARESFLDFAVLDVERALAPQGEHESAYDLVIAANVLHATRRIRQTVRNVKHALKENGWLLLYEGTGAQDFMTITFGLLDGWWLFEDAPERMQHSPLLAPPQWEALLRDEGFPGVVTLGGASDVRPELFQRVIVGQSDGLLRGLDVGAAAAGEPANMPPVAIVPRNEDIESTVLRCIAEVLELDPARLDPDVPFMELGVDSIIAVDIINRLNETLGVSLRTTDLFHSPSPRELCRAIPTVPSPGPPQAEPQGELLDVLQQLERGALSLADAERLLGAMTE